MFGKKKQLSQDEIKQDLYNKGIIQVQYGLIHSINFSIYEKYYGKTITDKEHQFPLNPINNSSSLYIIGGISVPCYFKFENQVRQYFFDNNNNYIDNLRFDKSGRSSVDISNSQDITDIFKLNSFLNKFEHIDDLTIDIDKLSNENFKVSTPIIQLSLSCADKEKSKRIFLNTSCKLIKLEQPFKRNYEIIFSNDSNLQEISGLYTNQLIMINPSKNKSFIDVNNTNCNIILKDENIFSLLEKFNKLSMLENTYFIVPPFKNIDKLLNTIKKSEVLNECIEITDFDYKTAFTNITEDWLEIGLIETELFTKSQNKDYIDVQFIVKCKGYDKG